MDVLHVWLALAAAAALLTLAGYTVRAGAAGGTRTFTAGFATALIAVSFSVYALIGHPTDWQPQGIDGDVGYLRAQKLNRAIQAASEAERNPTAQLDLAKAHLEVGRYGEAVDALDRVLAMMGETPDLLGLKVFALYYRDGRRITEETQGLIDRVFALDPYEVQTRMLLGQHDFLNGRYEEALENWRDLLESGRAPGKERALRNAMAKAEALSAQKGIK